jgi:hypothetical protein
MLSSSTKRRAMTDFFISYTQEDRAWAEWIAWTLEEPALSEIAAELGDLPLALHLAGSFAALTEDELDT